tara:strand:- start:4916 stop:5542 length:627 start_codon:yes stop_codon:yes gene_type:complete
MNAILNTFTSFTTSNCYIIKPFNDEKCFIIDLPPDLDPVLNFIKENNLSIAGALLTHGHYDHALGLQNFDGQAYINLDDEFLARNPHEQIKSLLGQNVDIEEYKGDLNSVDNLISEHINVYKNPGHTKGSVSYEFPNEGIIFTGDFVFKDSIGRTDLFSGSSDEMVNSLNSTFSNFNEDFEIHPGHGPSGKVRSIRNNNEFIKALVND